MAGGEVGERGAQGVEGGLGGRGARRVWTATAWPFSSIHVPWPAPERFQQPRQLGADGGDAGVRFGVVRAPVAASQRSAP